MNVCAIKGLQLLIIVVIVPAHMREFIEVNILIFTTSSMQLRRVSRTANGSWHWSSSRRGADGHHRRPASVPNQAAAVVVRRLGPHHPQQRRMDCGAIDRNDPSPQVPRGDDICRDNDRQEGRAGHVVARAHHPRAPTSPTHPTSRR